MVSMARRVVTVHEAKTHLSRLVKQAVEGEEIVIARGRQPLVRLVPLPELQRARRFGTAKNMIEIRPDFDDWLPDFDAYAP